MCIGTKHALFNGSHITQVITNANPVFMYLSDMTLIYVNLKINSFVEMEDNFRIVVH